MDSVLAPRPPVFELRTAQPCEPGDWFYLCYDLRLMILEVLFSTKRRPGATLWYHHHKRWLHEHRALFLTCHEMYDMATSDELWRNRLPFINHKCFGEARLWHSYLLEEETQRDDLLIPLRHIRGLPRSMRTLRDPRSLQTWLQKRAARGFSAEAADVWRMRCATARRELGQLQWAQARWTLLLRRAAEYANPPPAPDANTVVFRRRCCQLQEQHERALAENVDTQQMRVYAARWLLRAALGLFLERCSAPLQANLTPVYNSMTEENLPSTP